MSTRNEDFLFAQEAQSRGFVTEAQVEEGLMLQKRMTDDLKIDERLAVILVKRGWLAEEQAKQVYSLIEPEGRQTQIEGYRLVEKIGRGAMGTVYKAIHLNLHRVVAIKILRRELISEKTHVERLKSEAAILASLDHPNIVRALDAGESNGFPYVVMEYVEGETLRDRINREGPLPENEALRITRALADALERARRMGVVHRDVKPGNVLLGKKGKPKLMDLGLAKGPVDLELTQHGATVGTPQFISPEQAEDPRKADTRSDIYSLGATLYAMLTGRPPFKGATLAEILTKVLYEQPTPVRARNQKVSPETGYLVERMMLKDVSLRYQTPAQVVDDVDEIVGGRSIIPDGFQGNWEAFLLRKRNKKRWRLAGITAVTLLVAGLVALGITNHEAKKAAEARVDSNLEQAVTSTKPENDDTAVQIADKLRRAELAYSGAKSEEREHGIEVDRKRQLAEQIEDLKDLDAQFRLFESVAASCDGLIKKYDFESALTRCEEHRFQHPPRGPVSSASGNLELRIRFESERTWRRFVNEARTKGASDLAEFVGIWTRLKEDLANRFVVPKLSEPRAELENYRSTALALAKAAGDIAADVVNLVAAYEPVRVEQAFATFRAGELRAALVNDIEDRRGRIFGLWKPHVHWREMDTLLARGERTGHVTQIVRKLERDVDAQVTGLWDELEQRVDDLEAGHAVEAAEDILTKFIRDLERSGMYPELQDEAEKKHGGLLMRRNAAIERAKAILERALREVLAGLRAGDRAAIKRAIASALKEDRIWPRKTKIEDLRSASDALGLLYKAAAAHVADMAEAANATPVQMQRKDGTVFTVKKFKVVSIDGGHRIVASGRGRSSRETQTYELEKDFPLEQLLAWAVSGPSDDVLDTQSRLIVELALIKPVDPTAADLRHWIRRYREIQKRMDKANYQGVWSKYVDRNLDLLERLQEEREVKAMANYLAGTKKFGKEEYFSAKRHLDEFLDSPFETDAKDKYKEDARNTDRKCEAELDNNKLAQWLRGFIPKDAVPAIDGTKRVTITANFDDPEQMSNFKHVLGRLELEAGAVVSPDPVTEHHLHLLAGERGVRRGRPLSIESMFDPAYEISLEFEVDLLGGSIVLAFDIDGVQLAIVSADPNFHPNWRIPLAPEQLGKDGQSLVDYYGRGRGIAYRHGIGFGELWGPKWSWLDRQQGRHYERWAKQREPLDGSLKQELFALPPAFRGRIRVVRNLDKLELWIAKDPKGLGVAPAFENVFNIQRSDWKDVGSRSERPGFKMSKGTGLLQILTWTPMIIDDLKMTGVVRTSWRKAQEAKEAARVAKEAEEKARREAGKPKENASKGGEKK